MSVTMEQLQGQEIREEACETVEQKLIDVLSNTDLNLKELMWVLGQLLIDTGASLDGVADQPHTYQEMWLNYSKNPGLGTALMAQGADIHIEWLKIEEKK